MLRSKKIVKLRKKHAVRSKNQENKIRCRFQQIPLNTKYSHINPVYPLLGDIPLMEYNGTIVTEFSFYNEFKIFQDLAIQSLFDQKVLVVRPTPRKDIATTSWSEIIERFAQSESSDLVEWAQVLKMFCQKYDKVMKRQSRKKTKSDVRRKFYTQVTEESELIREKLFRNYPCLQLKFRVKSHHNQLCEIIFNERFVKDIGYSFDTLITTLFQEGIPQLMPFNEDASINFAIRTLIQNYFTIGDRGCEISGLETLLLMRGGLAKRVKYQMHFLMNYDVNSFGMDVLMTLVSQDEPFLTGVKEFNNELNKSFVNQMIIYENNLSQFLGDFYGQPTQKYYTNIDLICLLKEIEHDDQEEIIVKKNEET